MNETNKTVVLTHVSLPMLHLGELLASVFEEALEGVDLRVLVVLVDCHHVPFILNRAVVDSSVLDHGGDVLGGRRALMPALAFLAHDGGRCGGWYDILFVVCARGRCFLLPCSLFMREKEE